jgi:hypothetical protein
MIQYTIMQESERCKKIIEYVYSHQGSFTEEAFNAVKEHMARSTFFKDLGKLIENKEIKVEYPNKRDHILYPNNDLLFSVPQDLQQFTNHFYTLLDKGQQFLEEIANGLDSHISELPEERIYMIIRPAVRIFFEVSNLYNYHALLVWPNYIKEPAVLNKLYLLVFEKINNMRNEIISRYQYLLPGEMDKLPAFLPISSLRSLQSDGDGLATLNTYYKSMGLETEFVSVMKHLKKITNDLQKNAFKSEKNIEVEPASNW